MRTLYNVNEQTLRLFGLALGGSLALGLICFFVSGMMAVITARDIKRGYSISREKSPFIGVFWTALSAVIGYFIVAATARMEPVFYITMMIVAFIIGVVLKIRTPNTA